MKIRVCHCDQLRGCMWPDQAVCPDTDAGYELHAAHMRDADAMRTLMLRVKHFALWSSAAELTAYRIEATLTHAGFDPLASDAVY